jgi:hypothetical protein
MALNNIRRLSNDEILERVCKDVRFVLTEKIYNDQIIKIISSVIIDIQCDYQVFFADEDRLFNLLNSKKEALSDFIIGLNNVFDENEMIEDLYTLLTSKID